MMTDNDALQKLKAALAEARKALKFYADPISYIPTQVREPRTAVHGDKGRMAKKVLASTLEHEVEINSLNDVIIQLRTALVDLIGVANYTAQSVNTSMMDSEIHKGLIVLEETIIYG